MPVATTTGNETKRFDLKTLPEGYVLVRRQTYGEYMARREEVSQMLMTPGEDGEKMESRMQLVSFKATALDFANCIVDHNLTTPIDGPTPVGSQRDDVPEGERLLNFKKAADVRALDPRIGDEIGKYIDEMNQFNEEDQGNS